MIDPVHRPKSEHLFCELTMQFIRRTLGITTPQDVGRSIPRNAVYFIKLDDGQGRKTQQSRLGIEVIEPEKVNKIPTSENKHVYFVRYVSVSRRGII